MNEYFRRVRDLRIVGLRFVYSLDQIANGGAGEKILIHNHHSELVLKSHAQLEDIDRVDAQIVQRGQFDDVALAEPMTAMIVFFTRPKVSLIRSSSARSPAASAGFACHPGKFPT